MNSDSMPNQASDNETLDQPFYATNTWFSVLKKTTWKNCKLLNISSEGLILPHITETKGLFRIRHLSSLSNYYTPEFNVKTSSERKIADIYNKEIKDFDVITLNPLSIENVIEISKNLKKQGFGVFIDYKTHNWFESNIDSIKSYWELRPSRLTNTINRKQKKAEKDPQFSLKLYNQHNETELRQLLRDYHTVYNKSWKIREAFPEFIDAIALHESARGNLRIGIAYKGETPVAAQIWFKHQRTAYIFKLAYDEEFRNEGYGNIVTKALVDFSIERDGVNKIDFLTGNDAYKKDWMGSYRVLYTLNAINKRTLKGWCLFLAKKTKLCLKGLKKHILGQRE